MNLSPGWRVSWMSLKVTQPTRDRCPLAARLRRVQGRRDETMQATGNRTILSLAMLAIGLTANAQSAGDPPESGRPADAAHGPAVVELEPIDLSALPAMIVSIENVDLDDIHSGIVCRRVRVIYSLVPRTFCTTRERLLALQGRSSRDRVARDIRNLSEIRRYQMRNQINRALNSQN